MAFFYYLGTAAESVLSVFGIRGTYEHPKYVVVGQITPEVEERAYAERVAVETPIERAEEGAAFGRLFRYITGANAGQAHIAMTVPVQMGPAPSGEKIAMTVPVETSPGAGGDVMRFFLPRRVVEAGAPAPTDPKVHIVTLPPAHFAALRFSGTITAESSARQKARLMAALAGAHREAAGAPSVFGYDPPFTIPFLRRNEAVVEIK